MKINVQRPAITKHINNIYKEEELEERSTCSKMEHMGNLGNQEYQTKYYNLYMIISIGFRVNSKKAIKFRTWANKIIKEYMVQGFSLNEERFLKGKILKSDVTVAKNYLSETELRNLNNVVNIFLDIAEDNAERNIPMYMKDWKKEVDNVLTMRHYNILEGKGKISKKEAYEKAEKEYEKYRVFQDKKFVSDFDILILIY